MSRQQIAADRELVAAVLSGGAGDALRFVQRLNGVVRKVVVSVLKARRHLVQQADIDPLVNQVFDLVLTGDSPRLRSWDGRGTLEAWLAVIARREVGRDSGRLARDVLAKASGLQVAAEVPSPEPGPSELAEADELTRVRRGVRDGLPGVYAEIIRLFEAEVRAAGIAEHVGVSVSTVYRALDLYKTRLLLALGLHPTS